MLTGEENELLTRIGPGTPGGELMRRYWQPAALADELPPGGAPVPIRLFGEDLVLYRDEWGLPGLLGLHSSHRGADLSYGRLEVTDWGLRIYAIRSSGTGKYVRITNTVMANFTAFRGGEGEMVDGYSVNWHVAIDDTHHWKYTFIFRRDQPINKDETARARADLTPDYRLVRSKSNRYLQDRQEMKTDTFVGMGMAFQVHDTCATEGAGPIQDRTQEHLTPGEICMVTTRKLLLSAIEDVRAGRDPRHVVRAPAANHFPDLVIRSSVIPNEADHRTFWMADTRELASSAPA